jgi:ethanolamine ammonia-lyase large subunit
MAISRNHPEVTAEEVKEGLDFSNCQPLIGLLIVQNPTEEIRLLMEKVDTLIKNELEVPEE